MAAERVVFSRDLARVAGTLLIVLGWAMSANAQLPPAPEPDIATINAWNRGGGSYRKPGEERWDEGTLKNPSRPELPAFVLNGLSPRQLDALPLPKVPFQVRILELNGEKAPSWLTDAHLLSLSRYDNLAEISVSWFRVDTSVPLRRFGLLKTLRHLDLITISCNGAPPIQPEELRSVAELPALSSLHFATFQFDKGIEWIERLNSLRTLELTGCVVTNAGMASLNELKDLEELTVLGIYPLLIGQSIDEFSPAERNVKVIREELISKGADAALFPPAFTEAGNGLKRLRTLKLFGTEVTDSGLAGIARLPSLQVLDLSAAWISDGGIANLVGAPELQTLILSKTPATGVGFPALPRLSRLDLSDSLVTDKGLEDFDDLPELRSLDLSRTRVTLIGLRHADQLLQLGSLNLSETDITADGLKNVGRMTALRSLDLSQTKTGSQGLKWLTPLKGLQHLNLSKTNLARAIPVAIAALEGLESLDLSQTMQTGAGLGTLAPLKRLHTLNLSDTRIDRHGFEQLARLTSLTSLDLSRTFAADRHIETLTALSGLENLTLCGTRVTDGVLPILERFPRLTTVDLEGCTVSPPALAAFRAAHPRIEVRNVSASR